MPYSNEERSTTMANEEGVTLVLKDGAGNYFLVSEETLEQGRVPEARTPELERILAEQQEVQGYVLPMFVAGIALGVWAAATLLSEGWSDSLSLEGIAQKMQG
jgi:hypothetical protein